MAKIITISGKTTRGTKNLPLTMHHVGNTDFHGCVDITDPMYSRDVWCRMNDIQIAEGTYACCFWRCEESKPNKDGYDFNKNRVFVLGIYLEGSIPSKGSMKRIGEIGVDSGTAGVFHNKPDYTDDEEFMRFSSKCDRLQAECAIMEEGSFFSESGYGDGGYPVFAKRNQTGEITALEVRFYEW